MDQDYDNAVFRIDVGWFPVIVNFDLWVERLGGRVALPLNAQNPLADLPKGTVVIVLTPLDKPMRVKSYFVWKIIADGKLLHVYATQKSCDPPIKFWHRRSVSYLGEWRTE